MNIALIIAGGTGQRMNQDIPKQFLIVHDKPIIIYTLETVQNHSEIDNIGVVCIDGWHEILKNYCRDYGISKLINIVSGGDTRHDSIYNGLISLKDIAQDDDVIILVDANRALISTEIITDNIAMCKKYGAAISMLPCVDSMYISNDAQYIENSANREILYKGHTPESAKYEKYIEVYEKANELNISNLAPSALLLKFGKKVAISKGSEKNIKITTPEDIIIFKALLNL